MGLSFKLLFFLLIVLISGILFFSINISNDISYNYSYDEELAKRVAHFAGITHCSRESVESWTCEKCKVYPIMKHVKMFYNEKHDV